MSLFNKIGIYKESDFLFRVNQTEVNQIIDAAKKEYLQKYGSLLMWRTLYFIWDTWETSKLPCKEEIECLIFDFRAEPELFIMDNYFIVKTKDGFRVLTDVNYFCDDDQYI